MPAKGRKRISQGDSDALVEKLGVIANLLGLVATKDLGEGEKVATLNAAGFPNQEIGRLLRKDVNTVKVLLFQHRKKSKPRGKGK